MDNNNENESADDRKRPGHPEEPLEVDIEFIDDGKASEIWDKIFELLESEEPEPNPDTSNESADPKPGQLTLF